MSPAGMSDTGLAVTSSAQKLTRWFLRMNALTVGLLSEAIRTACGMPSLSSAWLSDIHPLQCEITSNGLPSAKM